MQNTVTIILAHPNTDYRKSLLDECLANTPGPKILVSNFPVEPSTQELSTWTIFTDNNPLLYRKDYAKYGVSYNYVITDSTGVKHTRPFEYEHSYAVYTLIQEGLTLAKAKGFTFANIVNYDYLIEPAELEDNAAILQKNEYDYVMYRYSQNEYDGDYSTGIFSVRVKVALYYFNTYDSLHDFYSAEEFCLFENRYTRYLKHGTARVFEKSYEDLNLVGKVNREGLLQFSKSTFPLKTRSFSEISNDLDCDKTTYHEYDKVYPVFLEKFRDTQFNLFEIGIDMGKSYRLWEEYFPEAKIYGMDIGVEFKKDRGEVFKGDQSNLSDLRRAKEQIGSAKFILDDGSHVAEHQLITFEYLFQELLEPGGVYIIEDIECSYWRPDATIYGYPTGRLNIVDYFTKLNHQLNSRYNGMVNPLGIKSITFFENCIIIVKKEDGELGERQYRHSHVL